MASILRRLEPEDAVRAALILTGKVFPAWDERSLDVSWATIWRVVESLVSAQPSEVWRVASEGVDLGDAVRRVFEAFPRRRQATLFEEEFALREVYAQLEAIASAVGPGSRARKEAILRSLLSRVSPQEAWLLVNAMVGETRLGLSEGLLIDAIAEAYGLSRQEVERAVMVTGDPAAVIEAAARGGPQAVRSLRPEVFRPLRPMLAQTAETVDEALAELGGRAAFEYKLDGARVQIHARRGRVRVFSRRLSDVTQSIPDVVEAVQEGLRADEVILEGEVIAVGESGRPLPFQVLMRRFRRVNVTPELIRSIPLEVYLFDALTVDGRPLIDEPYLERRRALEGAISEPLRIVPTIVTGDPGEAGEFLERALSEGHEGLMAKGLRSPYTPGVRGKHWLKIKRAKTLDLVIVAAERGYGRRHRWFSDYYLAARDPETGEFLVVGKTFKGLTDEEFEWMTQRLREIAVEERGSFIRVRPEVVVEVAFNEVQRSPKYPSGYALRFARIVRIRDDKSPEEADTIDRVREIYESQFGGGGRA